MVNLGAGFQHSWWDKDEAPRSGSDFLLETQARAHAQDYLKVLRAQWISRVLGEQAYNDRKDVAGGFWSSMAHYQAGRPRGQGGGAGPARPGTRPRRMSRRKSRRSSRRQLTEADRKVVVGQDGTITIPAVAHSKPTGHFAAMKSFSGGMQLHCTGGFKAEYAFEAPRAGKYALTARVATVQEGQKFLFAANDAKAAGRNRGALHHRHVAADPAGRSLPGQREERPPLRASGRKPRGDDQGLHADAGEIIRREMNVNVVMIVLTGNGNW